MRLNIWLLITQVLGRGGPAQPRQQPFLAGDVSEPLNVCYFTNWAQFREDLRKIFPTSHVNFSRESLMNIWLR